VEPSKVSNGQLPELPDMENQCKVDVTQEKKLGSTVYQQRLHVSYDSQQFFCLQIFVYKIEHFTGLS